MFPANITLFHAIMHFPSGYSPPSITKGRCSIDSFPATPGASVNRFKALL
jgi:hypothetical protein